MYDNQQTKMTLPAAARGRDVATTPVNATAHPLNHPGELAAHALTAGGGAAHQMGSHLMSLRVCSDASHRLSTPPTNMMMKCQYAAILRA